MQHPSVVQLIALIRGSYSTSIGLIVSDYPPLTRADYCLNRVYLSPPHSYDNVPLNDREAPLVRIEGVEPSLKEPQSFVLPVTLYPAYSGDARGARNPNLHLERVAC